MGQRLNNSLTREGEDNTGKRPLERRGAKMMSAKAHEADLIGREELKDRLDRGDDFKLVMVLGEWEYRAEHIIGSLRVSTPEEGLQALTPDDEIVLYDSGPPCPASRMACRFLRVHGYGWVRRYAPGLKEWESAGYPLEGEHVG